MHRNPDKELAIVDPAKRTQSRILSIGCRQSTRNQVHPRGAMQVHRYRQIEVANKRLRQTGQRQLVPALSTWMGKPMA